MIHDIYISVDNNAEVIKIPIPPISWSFGSPFGITNFTTIDLGAISLIDERGVKSISITGFFPKERTSYSFDRSKHLEGWDYVKKIEEWRRRRIPVRLVITDTPMNIAMVINNFTYGVQDGTGDVYYTLQMQEFKFLNIQQSEVG